MALESIQIYQAISDGTVNLIDKVGSDPGLFDKKLGYSAKRVSYEILNYDSSLRCNARML